MTHGNESVLRRAQNDDGPDWSTDDWITIAEAADSGDGRYRWEPETLAKRVRRGIGPRTELHPELRRHFTKRVWVDEWMATIPKVVWPRPRPTRKKAK